MSVKKWMTHLNGHIACAIDTETTGVNPEIACMHQLAIVPLDTNLNVRTDVPTFDIVLRPTELALENIVWGNLPRGSKEKINNAVMSGIDPQAALDLFDYWFESCELHENKRITPIGHNYAFDRSMLQHWLGFEAYNSYFDSRYRDTLITASHMNDRAEFHANPIPFPKNLQLESLCTRMEVFPPAEETNYHDAFFDAVMTSKLYRAMCKEDSL